MTRLFKVGRVYDPVTRKEALETLTSLFANHWTGNLFQRYPEAKNITSMLKLFDERKNKNILLLVDATEDDQFITKKSIC